MSGKVRESPMSDIAYLRKLAERYRKLARSFKHAAIRDRLETLADDLEQKVRELQQPLPGMPIIRRYNPVHPGFGPDGSLPAPACRVLPQRLLCRP